jgi:putative phosphoesterase
MTTGAAVTRIGVISDTHGPLRDAAVAALQGSAAIVHAGDIGTPEVLTGLARIAPVTAVRGNNDRDAWAHDLPDYADLNIGALRIHVLHDLSQLQPEFAVRAAAVVSGHSHRARMETRNGVLYLNPGSAGPRRFRLPVSVALLEIGAEGDMQARIVELKV